MLTRSVERQNSLFTIQNKTLASLKKNKKSNFLTYGLLILNILLAALYGLSIVGGMVPPSKFALLSVLVVFFPLLFFSNLFFILFWLLFHQKYAILSLVALLLGFHSIPDHFAFNHSGATSDSTSALLKVVSYNVQRFSNSNDERKPNSTKQDIMHFLLKQKPDIACLQEYHSKNQSLYGPLKSTQKYLNTGSYFFQSYFGPRHNELIGLVIFSKFKKINNGYLKLKKYRTFAVYSDLLIGKDTIRVINIHLASISLKPNDIDFVANPAFTEKSECSHVKKIYHKMVKAYILHEKQMKAVMDLVKSSPYQVILCGDMNDTPGSYSYRMALQQLTDTFKAKGSGMSISYAGHLPFLRIDYIMKKGKFKTFDYQRIKIHFSDHYPLVVRFQIAFTK